MSTVRRVRLTPEGKRWLARFTAPVNPAIKPFLDQLARMAADAVLRDEAAKHGQEGRP
jgi:hypothetical protein